MSYPLYYAFDGAAPPARSGAAHATIYPYGPFPAGDGATVMLGLQNEREWQLFCERVLEQPALARDPRFASNAARTQARDALRAIIVETFAALSGEQVTARLDAAQIANARVNTMADVWRHPQLQARGRWAKVGSPAGELDMLKPPFNLSGFEPRLDAVPALGEHSRAILAEVGYSEAEIDRLASTGAT